MAAWVGADVVGSRADWLCQRSSAAHVALDHTDGPHTTESRGRCSRCRRSSSGVFERCGVAEWFQSPTHGTH